MQIEIPFAKHARTASGTRMLPLSMDDHVIEKTRTTYESFLAKRAHVGLHASMYRSVSGEVTLLTSYEFAARLAREPFPFCR